MSQQTPGTFSGMKGAVANGTSVLSAVGEWSVSLKAENQAVVDSSTAGGTVRVGGNTDWSGRYQANGLPAVHAGDSFAFIGSIDGAEGVSGTAIVDSVKIDWDIAGGKVVRHAVTFSANGPLAEGPAVAIERLDRDSAFQRGDGRVAGDPGIKPRVDPYPAGRYDHPGNEVR